MRNDDSATLEQWTIHLRDSFLPKWTKCNRILNHPNVLDIRSPPVSQGNLSNQIEVVQTTFKIGVFELNLTVNDRYPADGIVTVDRGTIYRDVELLMYSAHMLRMLLSPRVLRQCKIFFSLVWVVLQAVGEPMSSQMSTKRPYSMTNRLGFSNEQLACATGFAQACLISVWIISEPMGPTFKDPTFRDFTMSSQLHSANKFVHHIRLHLLSLNKLVRLIHLPQALILLVCAKITFQLFSVIQLNQIRLHLFFNYQLNQICLHQALVHQIHLHILSVSKLIHQIRLP